MESDTCDVVRVAFKGHDRIWIGRCDIVQADHMAASCGEVSFVRRYA
jgi:hypothetical protein